MLASVEEQSRWERMPRCASTARTYCRIGACSGRVAAGREPISLVLTVDAPAGGALIFQVARALHRARQHVHQLVHALVAFRADIHLAARRLGDGVDAAAAFDQADVDRRFRPRIQPRFGEQRDGAAERVHRIADAEIAPAMAAGSGEGDLEATAAQRAGGDVVGVGAIHDQEAVNLLRRSGDCLRRDGACRPGCPRPLRRRWRPAAGRARTSGSLAESLPGARDGQQCGQSGAVIADRRGRESGRRYRPRYRL